MEITVLGIDLAKDVFQLHGVNASGQAVLRKKVRRQELLGFIANLRPCLIGIEACGGSHFWAREFQKLGHRVRMISPQFVKPFVKSNKNDAHDAEAIAEAVVRPSMRFVAIKQAWQQDLQNLHRIRQRLIRSRTALSNEIRGLLQEYGIVLPKSIAQLKKQLPAKLETAGQEDRITRSTQVIFMQLYDELIALEKEVSRYDDLIKQAFRQHEVAQRIKQVPGVGVLTATAVVAAVGDPKAFKNGRQFSAWLGLVPKQNSSGGKTVLQGISKRGDKYIRCLLIHGARSVLQQAERYPTDPRSCWAVEKAKTRGHNRACVAIANRNARIIWALMSKGESYRQAA